MAAIDNYALELRRRGLADATIYKRRRCVELLAMKHPLATTQGYAQASLRRMRRALLLLS